MRTALYRIPLRRGHRDLQGVVYRHQTGYLVFLIEQKNGLFRRPDDEERQWLVKQLRHLQIG